MKKIKWCLKQLLPLTYRSKYSENGKKYFTVFKMFLGKCYKIETYEISE